MGDTVSKSSNNVFEAYLTNLNPSSADWLTKHTSFSNLPYIQVERLWIRFQQLRCEADGILSESVLRHPVNECDPFVSKILRSMLGSDGRLTFYKFLRIMEWMESATPSEKITEMFRVISKADVLSSDNLRKILEEAVYPEKNKETIKERLQELQNRMNCNERGEIMLQAFTDAVLQTYKDDIDKRLEFKIIPKDVEIEIMKLINQEQTNSKPAPGVETTVAASSEALKRSETETIGNDEDVNAPAGSDRGGLDDTANYINGTTEAITSDVTAETTAAVCASPTDGVSVSAAMADAAEARVTKTGALEADVNGEGATRAENQK